MIKPRCPLDEAEASFTRRPAGCRSALAQRLAGTYESPSGRRRSAVGVAVTKFGIQSKSGQNHSNLLEGSAQVIDNIVPVFQADGEPDASRLKPPRALHLVWQS